MTQPSRVFVGAGQFTAGSRSGIFRRIGDGGWEALTTGLPADLQVVVPGGDDEIGIAAHQLELPFLAERPEVLPRVFDRIRGPATLQVTADRGEQRAAAVEIVPGHGPLQKAGEHVLAPGYELSSGRAGVHLPEIDRRHQLRESDQKLRRGLGR